ncbi:hypothetical protein [Streptomyces catenulae]|uniref:NlpC/P60 domain-containing protein n=1 Tax=Streptomyces catenulae TaxID=66875 RepID=A0ABV2YXW3_9ACTN|nr:hypothetical protein [Streptomyces catenulae]
MRGQSTTDTAYGTTLAGDGGGPAADGSTATDTRRTGRRVLRRVLPALAAAGLGITAFAGVAHGQSVSARPAAAQTQQAAEASSFPTWGTRWVVHSSADAGSPAVGMLNEAAAGQDRITADYQVDTGRKVCEGDACSTYMAHVTGPVEGFLSVVAVAIPEDRLPGVPVKDGPAPQEPSASRTEMLRRAATWLTANDGAQVPYSQADYWKDGYRQDCSGYVSMTLGLPTPGTNTVGLANDRSLTRPISLGELTPGDLLIDADGDNNNRHVVIFEKWNDDAHSSYTAYEQRGGHGTDHRTLTYGLPGGDQEFKPYRPVAFGD